MGIVAIVLLTVMMTLSPAAAHATGIKTSVNVNSASPPDRSDHRSEGDRRGDHLHRRAPAVVVVPVPVYLASPRRCVAPGYWAYSWVPQSYVSNMWVPGYYNDDARWIEGHDEPRSYAWGYYAPYWVPERSEAC